MYHGIKFDSLRERDRYILLDAWQSTGVISGLRMQVKYLLIPKQSGERSCSYVADFVYERDGETIVEDVKGIKTQLYILKRKLMQFVHGIKVVEV
jgi:hypothetical protein